MIIIYIYRSHAFDDKQKKAKPQRKSGAISSFNNPARGSTGVRAYHKVNEEKILPHRRLGFTDEEMDEMMKDN
jgi:hypothetical protein